MLSCPSDHCVEWSFLVDGVILSGKGQLADDIVFAYLVYRSLVQWYLNLNESVISGLFSR